MAGRAPLHAQNGLTTTSTTVAANSSTDTSLKTRNQRSLRRLAQLLEVAQQRAAGMVVADRREHQHQLGVAASRCPARGPTP